MVVPRLRVGPRGSLEMEKEAASDSQMYCSSSLCFDVTMTVSETARVGEGRRRGGRGGEGEWASMEWQAVTGLSLVSVPQCENVLYPYRRQFSWGYILFFVVQHLVTSLKSTKIETASTTGGLSDLGHKIKKLNNKIFEAPSKIPLKCKCIYERDVPYV